MRTDVEEEVYWRERARYWAEWIKTAREPVDWSTVNYDELESDDEDGDGLLTPPATPQAATVPAPPPSAHYQIPQPEAWASPPPSMPATSFEALTQVEGTEPQEQEMEAIQLPDTLPGAQSSIAHQRNGKRPSGVATTAKGSCVRKRTHPQTSYGRECGYPKTRSRYSIHVSLDYSKRNSVVDIKRQTTMDFAYCVDFVCQIDRLTK